MPGGLPSSIVVLMFLSHLKGFLCFTIFKALKKSENKELQPWIKEITNHFWYCAKKSSSYIEFIVRSYFLFDIKSVSHFCYTENKKDIFHFISVLFDVLFLVKVQSLWAQCDPKYPFVCLWLEIIKEEKIYRVEASTLNKIEPQLVH